LKEFITSQIRNLALLSHGGVGKTSLAESMLFLAGATPRLGKVDDGSSVLDHAEEEVRRKLTISLGLAQFEWKGAKVNLLDTPGYADFVSEVVSALAAADAVLLLVRASTGVEVGTEITWERIKDRKMPVLLCVNQMDKEHADFEKAVASVRDRLGVRVVAVQIPIGQAETFTGVVDLLRMKAFVTKGRGQDAKTTEQEIPAELKDRAQKAREQLIEEAASGEEALMEKFFAGETLSDDEIVHGLERGVANGSLIPAFASSAHANIGVRELLDDLVGLVPPPDEHPPVIGTVPGTEKTVEIKADSQVPLAAQVFKTMSEAHVGDFSLLRIFSGHADVGKEVLNTSRGQTEKLGNLYFLVGKERVDTKVAHAGDIVAAVKLKSTHTGDTLAEKTRPVVMPSIPFPEPVMAEAIRPKAKGDEDKLGTALARVHEEDPTFRAEVDGVMHQTLVRGQGDLHVEVSLERIKRRFHVDVEMAKPRVAYRETIRAKAQGEYRHKKQTGGRGQFGEVHLRLEPLPRSTGFEFKDEIKGGVVPNQYIPAVEKGIVEAMTQGVVAGYPVVDVRAALFFGKYHDVDSSEMAFKIAAIQCFKDVAEKAQPVLLEPIAEVVIRVPEEFMGDVMGDVSSRRGKILGMESDGHYQVVKAMMPEAELYKYSTHLRSISQGRARHRQKFSHYEEVPRELAEKVISAARAEKEAEARA
jgi:elongation factor G